MDAKIAHRTDFMHTGLIADGYVNWLELRKLRTTPGCNGGPLFFGTQQYSRLLIPITFVFILQNINAVYGRTGLIPNRLDEPPSRPLYRLHLMRQIPQSIAVQRLQIVTKQGAARLALPCKAIRVSSDDEEEINQILLQLNAAQFDVLISTWSAICNAAARMSAASAPSEE